MKASVFSPVFALVALTLALAGHAAEAPVSQQPLQADADGVQRVTIIGGSYFFRPDQIVAQAGRPLEITLKSEPGIVPHRFVLVAADGQTLVDVDLGQQPQTVRLQLNAGEYAFHCPNQLLFFKSHRERGMAGVLHVRE